MLSTTLLFGLVGTGPWLLANAIFVELPFFLLDNPSLQLLPVYLSVAVQLPNIFLLLTRAAPSASPSSLPRRLALLILLAAASSLVLAFTSSLKLPTTHPPYPLPILTSAFISGVVGCLSVPLTMPYAAQFSDAHIAAASAGGGFASAVPSLVGMAQDPGGALRFGPNLFFVIMAVVLGASVVAVALIQRLRSTVSRDDCAKVTPPLPPPSPCCSRSPRRRFKSRLLLFNPKGFRNSLPFALPP
jgi:hypothetical protein